MTEIQKLKDTPEMRRDFYSMHSYRIPNMEGGPPRRNCCGDEMKLPSTAGLRRKITNEVLRQIFDHWCEIEPGCKETRGQLTLTHLYRTEPAQYAKLVAALLPKDILIESAVGEMDDDQIDDVIAHQGKADRCKNRRSQTH